MIRKAIIVVLMLLAVGMVTADAASRRGSFRYLARFIVFPRLATYRGEVTTTPGEKMIVACVSDRNLWVWYARCLKQPAALAGSVKYRFLRFGYTAEVTDEGTAAGSVIVDYQFFWTPLWFWGALVAVYPTIAFIRGPFRRWRRGQKAGLCLTCGYNLTGNVSGVCPECGTDIKP